MNRRELFVGAAAAAAVGSAEIAPNAATIAPVGGAASAALVTQPLSSSVTHTSTLINEIATPTPIPSVRRSPQRAQVDTKLGFLAELAGTWEGFGFNLIGRPDKQGGSPVFLELNQTFETLSFIPISSSIPNRGFVVDDIELFGLTYLQKISDATTGGALHIEPGIWIHIPSQDIGTGEQRKAERRENGQRAAWQFALSARRCDKARPVYGNSLQSRFGRRGEYRPVPCRRRLPAARPRNRRRDARTRRPCWVRSL